MKIWCLLALAALRCTAAERITLHQIKSEALGRPLPVAVIAPGQPGAAAVLFILHGRGGSHRSLIDSPAAQAALRNAPFYVVLPEGEDGWYIDWPTEPQLRYGVYLAEVIAWAEKNLPVRSAPESRGIAGWSMGGYGAVRFAELHAGQFGFVASIMGVLDFPRAEDLPAGQNYAVPTRTFTGDPRVWAAMNPLRPIGNLRTVSLSLIIAESGFDRTMNENFLAALARDGMSATIHRLPGDHDFAFVERALPLLLADAGEFFARSANYRATSTNTP